MARSIIHGPVWYGGMNLPHLYTYQGVSQLKFLFGHLRAQDKTPKLILINHGCHQLLVGITANFLHANCIYILLAHLAMEIPSLTAT
jgi:hypothetical protein